MDFKMIGLPWNTLLFIERLLPFYTPSEIRDIVCHTFKENPFITRTTTK